MCIYIYIYRERERERYAPSIILHPNTHAQSIATSGRGARARDARSEGPTSQGSLTIITLITQY